MSLFHANLVILQAEFGKTKKSKNKNKKTDKLNGSNW
jgi:hypothetical protein